MRLTPESGKRVLWAADLTLEVSPFYRGPGAAPQRVRSNVLSEDQVKLRDYFIAQLATPRGLLHKVWFDLSGHMDPRLADKIQELTRETFKIARRWNPEKNCLLASIYQVRTCPGGVSYVFRRLKARDVFRFSRHG